MQEALSAASPTLRKRAQYVLSLATSPRDGSRGGKGGGGVEHAATHCNNLVWGALGEMVGWGVVEWRTFLAMLDAADNSSVHYIAELWHKLPALLPPPQATPQVDKLQHTAAHCCTLLHTATHCNALQRTATHCNALQRTATHCNTLQHTATHCNTLQCSAAQVAARMRNDWSLKTHCNTQQHTATHCNTLQHTATHCNTL